MKILDSELEKHIDSLIARYPSLEAIRREIIDAYLCIETCYERGGKLLIAGNGGSAADCEHIVGELMRRFQTPRPVPSEFAEKLKRIDPVLGADLSRKLERSLTAIPLTAHESLSTACMNDVDAEVAFAQQLYGFGRPGDVFLGISTSGNSKNIIAAAVVAKAMDIQVVALTGRSVGALAEIADFCVRAPADETYMIQELHLPIYHCWCMMLEHRFFVTIPSGRGKGSRKRRPERRPFRRRGR